MSWVRKLFGRSTPEAEDRLDYLGINLEMCQNDLKRSQQDFKTLSGIVKGIRDELKATRLELEKTHGDVATLRAATDIISGGGFGVGYLPTNKEAATAAISSYKELLEEIQLHVTSLEIIAGDRDGGYDDNRQINDAALQEVMDLKAELFRAQVTIGHMTKQFHAVSAEALVGLAGPDPAGEAMTIYTPTALNRILDDETRQAGYRAQLELINDLLRLDPAEVWNRMINIRSKLLKAIPAVVDIEHGIVSSHRNEEL